jgi:methyltransferase (TIGR00027 family)
MMKTKNHSRTAESAAALRAAHLLGNGPIVFDDPFAIEMTSPRMRWILKNSLLRWIMGILLGDMGKICGQILVRGRYAEDLLEQASSAGITQYVLVSAGFDSFAFRRPDLADTFSVFELDHPATQKMKLHRISGLDVALPENLEFVPVDFETESISSALGRTSYAVDQKTFFSWLGTIPYLTQAAIFSTLESIASISAPGSEIVFDFAAPIEYAQAKDRPALEKLMRYTARRGEPIITFFDPEPFLTRVCKLGFKVVETVSPEEQNIRYFKNSPRGWRTVPIEFLAQLRRGN